MDFKFGKDAGEPQQQDAPDEKKKQSALIALLLILVGGFVYIYFFTGLVKPQEAPKTAAAPTATPQVVKMPLPLHGGGEPAKQDDTATAKAEPAKTAANSAAPAPAATAKPAAPAAAPASKPAAAPASKPAAAPAAKTAAPPAKVKEEPKKAEQAKPADKKPLPAATAEKKTDKAPAAKTAEKKSEAAKDGAKKTAAEVPAKQETAAKAPIAAPSSWTVVVGSYVLEEALSTDMGRVRKAGLEPVVKPAARKKTSMNRLFVSDFNDRDSAHANLEKLKRHTSDAFVIEQGGKFSVYAGSYLQAEAANSERDRLKAAGISAILKPAEIAIPSQSLTVGPFKNRKAADAALGKLKTAGVKASISQQ